MKKTLILLCLVASLLVALVPMGSGANAFADTAFESVWKRTDKPIADGRTARSWMWGPEPFTDGMQEAYAESPGGVRTVQYFDKSRMEINDPNADRSSQWFVTNGLLVREMVDGKVQTGNASYETRSPAGEAVAGDPVANNPNCPTYASFTYLTWTPASDRTGQKVTATLARAGTVGDDASKGDYSGTTIAHFESTTSHNVPQVLWDFMNASGLIYSGGYKNGKIVDWLFAMGYPISEPYWTRCTVGGVEKDVLVQLFERRVLTYTPSNSAGWQVEMGNVGRHYYNWRYSGGGGGGTPPVQPPAPTQPPSIGCEGVPASTNGISIPVCGKATDIFLVSATGFNPGEEVGFWVNDLNGPIMGTATTYYVDSYGHFDGWFVPQDVGIFQPGLYAWVFQGTKTTHQSIIYFKITQ